MSLSKKNKTYTFLESLSLCTIRHLYLVSFCLLFLDIKAQNTVVCRVSPTAPNTINIKWYSQKLIYNDGVNIYRKINNDSTWSKLNTNPLKKGNYKIPQVEVKNDSTLTDYVQMLDNTVNFKGIPLLAILLKSFKSEVYAKYMGIQYDDTTAEIGKTYQYKAAEMIAGKETTIATSLPLEIKSYTPIAHPQSIEIKLKNKKPRITWTPEPFRYFAVNIYRYSSENKAEIKLNDDAIIATRSKDKNGVENYPKYFYSDEKIKQNITYYYTLAAIDFFGEESTKSEPIAVFIKDTDPPTAPENLQKTLKNKSVRLTWTKKVKEIDFVGYNVYRTNNSDSDYVKLNSSPLVPTDSIYIDNVTHFKDYFYTIASIDKDGNENRSVPLFVHVFDSEPPSVPKNVKVFSDTGKLNLSWDANTEPDLWGYMIYRTINKNSNSYVLITPQPVTKNLFVDDLPDNTKNNFLYKIVAMDSSYNKSDYSVFATNKMPDIVSPSAPFIKQVSQNEKSEVIIEWLPNAEPDLVGYNIYRKLSTDTSKIFKQQNIKAIDKKANSYMDINIIKGSAYFYYLTAVDSSGNHSLKSNVFKYQTKIPAQKEGITTIKLSAKYNERKKQIELEWSITDKKITSFVIYRQVSGEATSFPYTGLLTTKDFTDINITGNKVYDYQVRAYNQRGDVIHSSTIKVETGKK